MTNPKSPMLYAVNENPIDSAYLREDSRMLMRRLHTLLAERRNGSSGGDEVTERRSTYKPTVSRQSRISHNNHNLYANKEEIDRRKSQEEIMGGESNIMSKNVLSSRNSYLEKNIRDNRSGLISNDYAIDGHEPSDTWTRTLDSELIDGMEAINRVHRRISAQLEHLIPEVVAQKSATTRYSQLEGQAIKSKFAHTTESGAKFAPKLCSAAPSLNSLSSNDTEFSKKSCKSFKRGEPLRRAVNRNDSGRLLGPNHNINSIRDQRSSSVTPAEVDFSRFSRKNSFRTGRLSDKITEREAAKASLQRRLAYNPSMSRTSSTNRNSEKVALSTPAAGKSDAGGKAQLPERAKPKAMTPKPNTGLGTPHSSPTYPKSQPQHAGNSNDKAPRGMKTHSIHQSLNAVDSLLHQSSCSTTRSITNAVNSKNELTLIDNKLRKLVEHVIALRKRMQRDFAESGSCSPGDDIFGEEAVGAYRDGEPTGMNPAIVASLCSIRLLEANIQELFDLVYPDEVYIWSSE